MNTFLLETIRATFGTVSSLTADSGIVAVRNKTALRKLTIICEPFGATVEKLHGDKYPSLVRVTLGTI